MTASDIMAVSAALLNDADRYEFTDARLLPYIKKAWAEFCYRIRVEGIADIREVSSVISVPTSKTSITLSDIADLSHPIEVMERLSGSSDLYTSMRELEWEPELDKSDSLLYWTWREMEVKLLGANTARQVKLRYIKTPGSISTAASVISIDAAQLYLESRTASIAAGLAGGNFERAAALAADAETHFQNYLTMMVRQKQGFPVRHKGYRR